MPSMLPDTPQTSSTEQPAFVVPSFARSFNHRSEHQSRKSSGSNIGSTEMLGGSLRLRRSTTPDTSSISPHVVQMALNQLKLECWIVTEPYRWFPGQSHHSQKGSSDVPGKNRAWKECTGAAVRELDEQCQRTLGLIHRLKFMAVCACSLLVSISWLLDTKSSSKLLDNISADNPAALCIFFSSLSLSFAQIAEQWVQGCMIRICHPMNQINRFVLVQRRKYYMQYGIIPLLLFVARISADISMWILLGLIFRAIGQLGNGWGDVAMKTIFVVKAGSVVCPTIKFIRTAPALQSPFQSWPALILEIIFTFTRASYSSFPTLSKLSQVQKNERHHQRIEGLAALACNWKFGMGFGSDLQLCIPGLLELVISRRCKVSDVISCLCTYVEEHPQLLAYDIFRMVSVEVVGCSTKEDLGRVMQGLSKPFICDFLIAVFLREATGVDEQLAASRSLTSFRIELLCRLLHSGMNDQKTLAMAKSTFTPSKAFQAHIISQIGTPNSAPDYDDSLTQLLKVATVALQKGIHLADLMSLFEELIPSLLSLDVAVSFRVSTAITAFTAVWANSNVDADLEQFCRYRRSLKTLRSGHVSANDMWLNEVELALDYKTVASES